ncbi:HNH endonuclease [Devosia rhizoryzae]|uniref:HNH nuclease domain-containing protein n=1 Tax=Devosia rhizoryzae TaxID=2774137 RepID=A0ABX7C6N8_9HYPH|nr:HNH endonuclease [Devosia rhizoryzae]QQR39448.1 hypothetical protein JI748_00005 [Devosia rhizoryzae]
MQQRVVLYQSSRESGPSNLDRGYFATAIIDGVNDDPANEKRCLVRIKDFKPLEPSQRMMLGNLPRESALLSADNRLKGWKAAEDLRSISDEDFAILTGADEVDEMFGIDLVNLPKFRFRTDRMRDPEFTHLIYRAYRGRCAISGVTLLSDDGRFCGLEAAHIYPYRFLQLNIASAGILLAPSWHSRLDIGTLIIEDDYTWRTKSEDSDTAPIKNRIVRLPTVSDQWPDIALLQRKRALFGR